MDYGIFNTTFYKTPVKLLKKVSDGGYSTNDREEFIKTIYCDIQPYDADLTQLPYGLYENVTLKMYCEKDGDIKTGYYIRLEKEDYIITAVLKWHMGYKILLSRRDI